MMVLTELENRMLEQMKEMQHDMNRREETWKNLTTEWQKLTGYLRNSTEVLKQDDENTSEWSGQLNNFKRRLTALERQLKE